MNEKVNDKSNFRCEKCSKDYSGYQSLWIHNKKYHDTKLQTNENINNTKSKHFSDNNIKKYLCKFCNKLFSRCDSRIRHEKSCKEKHGLIVVKETEMIDLQNKVDELQKENKDLIPKSNYPINNHLIDIIVDKSKIIEELKNNDLHSVALRRSWEPDSLHLSVLPETNNCIIVDSFNSCNNIEENKDKKLIEELYKEIKLKDEKIKLLEDMYIKKQNRKDYPNKNVIYIVTTDDNKKKKIYIIGKAINLKNRLSSYNKTAEHEVIYYKSCGNEENMNVIELMVLTKLKEYKEKANRDRFILPVEKDISFFCNIIDNSINFYK